VASDAIEKEWIKAERRQSILDPLSDNNMNDGQHVKQQAWLLAPTPMHYQHAPNFLHFAELKNIHHKSHKPFTESILTLATTALNVPFTRRQKKPSKRINYTASMPFFRHLQHVDLHYLLGDVNKTAKLNSLQFYNHHLLFITIWHLRWACRILKGPEINLGLDHLKSSQP
jgi:hypothetical protein